MSNADIIERLREAAAEQGMRGSVYLSGLLREAIELLRVARDIGEPPCYTCPAHVGRSVPNTELIPFFRMPMEDRRVLLDNFRHVEWYSRDAGKWVPHKLGHAAQMFEEAYRVLLVPRLADVESSPADTQDSATSGKDTTSEATVCEKPDDDTVQDTDPVCLKCGQPIRQPDEGWDGMCGECAEKSVI